MLIHLFISVPRNDYLDEDMPDDEGIQGTPDDVGIPDLAADFAEEDIPACPIPSQPSRFPQQCASSGQTVVLRTDRFHRSNIQNPKPKEEWGQARFFHLFQLAWILKEECMDIKVNILTRKNAWINAWILK